MSGTTLLRGFTVLVALAVTACATTPTPPAPASLLDSVSSVPRATLSSCAALNMALVCESASLGRTAGSARDSVCTCGDRNELTMGGTRR